MLKRVNYFGLFLNDKDQLELRQFGLTLLSKILELVPIKNAFSNDSNQSISSLAMHWKRVPSRLHVTTKYCGKMNTKENIEYLSMVQSSLEKKFTLMVSGFLLTDRTFSCRASVDTSGEKLLKNAESNYSESEICHVSLACSRDSKAVQCKFAHMEASKSLGNLSRLECVAINEFGTVRKVTENSFFIQLHRPLSYETYFQYQ